MRRPRRRGAALLAACVWGALLGGCGTAEPPPGGATAPTTGAVEAWDVDDYATELVDLTNAARAERGLRPLDESPCARQAALGRAAALVGAEELEHAPLAPVIDACAPRTTAAENLVSSAAGPADVVDAWLGSAGHRANIVDPGLTELGIGCVRNDGELLCSQVFLGP